SRLESPREQRRSSFARAALARGAHARRGSEGGRCPRGGRCTTEARGAAMTSVLNPLNVVARINRDVERSLLRARNGVRYATTKANVGAAPRDVVWRRDRAELWRYRSATPIRYRPPVVIVHSLVSRSYILDLRPGSSAVEFFLGRGHD